MGVIIELTAPAIRATELSYRFGLIDAVHELSFDVPHGQIFGFLGPNGAGKTTTIRLLLGLLAPTGGSVEVLGHDTRREGPAIRACSGALLEFTGLYERLSAEDNLDFYLRAWRWSRAARAARIEELLTHLGLWERRRDLVATWSAGMKKTLAVARALAHRPQLLFLDEPSAALDAAAARSLQADLRTLVEHEGTTVFLTSHSLDEVEQLCSSVVILRRGQLVAHGTLDELRARAAPPITEITGRGFTPDLVDTIQRRVDVSAVEGGGGQLRFQLRPGCETAPIVSLLVRGEASVEEVRQIRPSLEQVYLDLLDGGT